MHPAASKAKFDAEIALLTPDYLRVKRWTLWSAAYPLLDLTIEAKRPLRLRVDCDNWNEAPPSVALLSPEGAFLTEAEVQPLAGSIFNHSAHEQTGRPFVCMRGVREFHTHSSHRHEVWDTYRAEEGNNILGIVSQITRALRKIVGA
ncbi:MAG: hypothetical protein GY844_11410 [Bradyrhizobium sp.]|uniref:Uncharacterized protein n=1 Tax=Afipia broomeae ATCC 49717 TaxID=883078 RepID=K8P156_9BRAD|nr:hypothetical protein [Afipia broomeae]EKS34474.1 hypothetical protein HMPREF9695_04384 [Afipia broomeae ATCC 49717]MCP4617031.1 hypothetical protein [Bradyrhizobium sp.]